ncbi:arginine-tRNA-protein transferase 1 [Byssothecium circinans]|uniref:Arginyl-tRNA--protein transferase 1 n=1 Tax=Byssothecium circinans TaxID=147558 RepID=A0A6A5TJP4_9PLEO|nr:arginine-tRNA-protein transferase 1 [Byssothecium circinans]
MRLYAKHRRFAHCPSLFASRQLLTRRACDYALLPHGGEATSIWFLPVQLVGHGKNRDGRASYYLSSQSLTVEVYQGLVDRGWRRSGTVFYKPDVLRHCCPHYTIRLPVASFTPSKNHRQAINRWNKFVLGETYIKEAARLHPKSKEEKARERNSFDPITAIRESEYDNIKLPPEPAHRFKVTLEPDIFSQEKYSLFRNYQYNVHKESPTDISEHGFKRFLCNSPLQRKTAQVNGKDQKLGSYHQCYWFDGRLIAMGVLDLLPHCVSGVYFIYHSDFEKFNFGKMSAVREAMLTLEGGYEYYYMGFYIHLCAKMRYKGEYRPQYVLDPESLEWNPLEGELRALLDRKRYVSLARERRRGNVDGKDTLGTVAEEKKAEEEEDDYSDFPLPTASEAGDAVTKGMSLFDLKIPGVMAAEEVERDYPLDRQRITARGRMFEAEDLMAWDDSNIKNAKSLKGIIAELVAVMGPEVAGQVVVAFT